jgi:signal peptidase I
MGDGSIQSRPTTAAATGVTGGLPSDAPRPDAPTPASGGARSALVFVGGLLGACLAVYLLLWWAMRLDGAPVVLRAVVVGLFGVSLAASAVFLWLACRLVVPRAASPPAPHVGLPRALVVALTVWATSLAAAAGLWYQAPTLPAVGVLVGGVLGLLVYAVIVLLCLLPFLSFGRAWLVGLIWQGLHMTFALVLIYLTKFALLEGFVVPTGAMAETILGYHKQVRCPACGQTFRVNASDEVEQGVRVRACACPNCRLPITLIDPKLDGHDPTPGGPEALDPGVSGGDRILVGKGPLGGAPDRLRPIVFRYPVDPRVTFIKRLVGLPGETIAIQDGDLYVLPSANGLTFPPLEGGEGERDGFPGGPVRQAEMHVNAPEALDRWRKGEFQILRKPPALVLAMRSLVHDADHKASDLGSLGQRWTGDGWQGASRDFRHAADGLTWLRYRHLLRGQAGPSLITDFSAYNSGLRFPGGEPNWVGDLILECEVDLTGSGGELLLELSKGPDRFRARFDLATGACKLTRHDGAGEKELASQPTSLKQGGEHRLRFGNVDQRLTVWVGDSLPFGDGVAYPPPATTGPDNKNDLEPASIGATAGVTVSGLKLWRDAYYTQPGGPGGAGQGPTTMYVQPGSYLVLGDNSAQSADSRSWGLVPERLIVGPVLLRYYPLDRAGRVE